MTDRLDEIEARTVLERYLLTRLLAAEALLEAKHMLEVAISDEARTDRLEKFQRCRNAWELTKR